MTDQTYAYPFDPTGESSNNLIVKESHVINPPDYTDFYFVVPTVGPFFEHNLEVRHWPSGRILINGVDFILSYKFLGASRATAKPVYGAISILDRVLSGVLEVTYQTIGGPWTIDEVKAAEMLSNATNNPRRTTWEQVVQLPHAFPVIDHEWDLVDMVGASDLRDAIDRISATLYDQIGAGASGDNHLTDYTNPHQVTKAQVGLGSVDNYPTASFTEAVDTAVDNRFMTPLRVSQLIDATVTPRLNDHINDGENPHGVTKEQIGLDRVMNYSIASDSVARDGISKLHYLTPYGASLMVDEKVADGISGHVSDLSNPHQVTKAQVGLGSVPNYAMATSTMALAGEVTTAFVSPRHLSLWADAIIDPSNASLTTIIDGRVNGPLETMRTSIINEEIVPRVNGVDDRVTAVANDISTHAARTDNPHGVTKADVGLDRVSNYAPALDYEAIDDTVNDRYMTPMMVSLAVDARISSAIDTVNDSLATHVNDITNPHQVTKMQVGLGNVNNYPMSTLAEAIEGISESSYMSPALTTSVVSSQIGSVTDKVTELDTEVDRLLSVTTYSYTLPENISGNMRYQKLAEMTIDNVVMSDLLTRTALIFNAEYRASEGGVGDAIVQQLAVVTDPSSQSLVIREVSLMEEVDSRFAVDVYQGGTQTTISVWRSIPSPTSDARITAVNWHEAMVLTPTTPLESALPTGAILSNTSSIGFSYRLATVLVEEFTQLASDLENIGV